MKKVALSILAGYKRWISPSLLPSCRYVPTCSEYAMEAIERFGVLRGGFMAACRLLRCHPFVKGGYDPVVKDSCFHGPPQDRHSGVELNASVNDQRRMTNDLMTNDLTTND